MEEKNKESDNLEQKEWVFKPKIINDPNCKHDYEYIFTDPEGYKNYRCKKCPMGKRVKNGKP